MKGLVALLNLLLCFKVVYTIPLSNTTPDDSNIVYDSGVIVSEKPRDENVNPEQTDRPESIFERAFSDLEERIANLRGDKSESGDATRPNLSLQDFLNKGTELAKSALSNIYNNDLVETVTNIFNNNAPETDATTNAKLNLSARVRRMLSTEHSSEVINSADESRKFNETSEPYSKLTSTKTYYGKDYSTNPYEDYIEPSYNEGTLDFYNAQVDPTQSFDAESELYKKSYSKKYSFRKKRKDNSKKTLTSERHETPVQTNAVVYEPSESESSEQSEQLILDINPFEQPTVLEQQIQPISYIPLVQEPVPSLAETLILPESVTQQTEVIPEQLTFIEPSLAAPEVNLTSNLPLSISTESPVVISTSSVEQITPKPDETSTTVVPIAEIISDSLLTIQPTDVAPKPIPILSEIPPKPDTDITFASSNITSIPSPISTTTNVDNLNEPLYNATDSSSQRQEVDDDTSESSEVDSQYVGQDTDYVYNYYNDYGYSNVTEGSDQINVPNRSQTQSSNERITTITNIIDETEDEDYKYKKYDPSDRHKKGGKAIKAKSRLRRVLSEASNSMTAAADPLTSSVQSVQNLVTSLLPNFNTSLPTLPTLGLPTLPTLPSLTNLNSLYNLSNVLNPLGTLSSLGLTSIPGLNTGGALNLLGGTPSALQAEITEMNSQLTNQLNNAFSTLMNPMSILTNNPLLGGLSLPNYNLNSLLNPLGLNSAQSTSEVSTPVTQQTGLTQAQLQAQQQQLLLQQSQNQLLNQTQPIQQQQTVNTANQANLLNPLGLNNGLNYNSLLDPLGLLNTNRA